MAGCLQYLTIDAHTLFLVSGSTASFPFAIPNDNALAGVAIQGQSATFSAGFNVLGVLTSNGLSLNLGTF